MRGDRHAAAWPRVRKALGDLLRWRTTLRTTPANETAPCGKSRRRWSTWSSGNPAKYAGTEPFPACSNSLPFPPYSQQVTNALVPVEVAPRSLRRPGASSSSPSAHQKRMRGWTAKSAEAVVDPEGEPQPTGRNIKTAPGQPWQISPWSLPTPTWSGRDHVNMSPAASVKLRLGTCRAGACNDSRLCGRQQPSGWISCMPC
jgi:hypothetical protein